MSWLKAGKKKGLNNCEKCYPSYNNAPPCLDLKTDQEKEKFVCHFYHQVTLNEANKISYFIWSLLDIHERPYVQGVSISLPIRLGCLFSLGQLFSATKTDLEKVILFEHANL